MKKFILSFIPEQYTHDVETFRKARLMVSVSFITSFFSAFYLLSTLYFHLHHATYVLVFHVASYLLLPFVFRYKILPMKWIANAIVLIGAAGVGIIVLYTGGIRSSVLPWFAAYPIVSLMITDKRSGWVWTILSYLAVTLVGVLAMKNFKFPDETNPAMVNVFNTTNLNGLVLIIFLIALVFENTKNGALKRLDDKNLLLAKEKQKSEELLLNILPFEVSEELKESGETKAKYFESATVLFTDFVGFTLAAEKLTPQELVDELHACFKAFDAIISNYDIEKIKTIGDAYLAVSGLPNKNSNHPGEIVKAAIDIREFMKARALSEKRTFSIRIGIHSGSVIAGVVGSKKFAYDIWGDAVNTAARMEQNSEAGKINISETTRNMILDEFDCTFRGEVEAKNKGKLKMYFVNAQIKK